MFIRIGYIVAFFLITVNSAYPQKPQKLDKQEILQNHPELQRLSYFSRIKQNKSTAEITRSLEEKGFKLLGQPHEIVSPRKDTLATDKRSIKVNVSFDLKNSGYDSINFNAKNNIKITDASSDTILTDGFENDFPGTTWQRSGDPTWGKTNYSSYQSNYSIWCAKAGTKGVEPGNSYPNGCHSMVIFGPFNLSDVNYAQLKFWYCLDTEYEKDWFFFMASIDGSNFQGSGISGESGVWGGAWDEDYLYLNNVLGLGNVTGHSQVWIAFLFESDNNSSSDEGVFVDNIEITKRQVNGTPLYGAVSGKLTSSDNPYIAVSDFGIAESDTLEIKPGVEIRAEDGVEFSVLGLLKAIGTPSDSILFTSANANPSPGDWRGIGLYDVASKDCQMQYCRIEYGGYGNTGAAGMYTDTPEAEISNCLIWKNRNAGIYSGGKSIIKNCRIIKNDNGISGWGSSTFITNNLISENEIGISLILSTDSIFANEICGNFKEGVQGNTSDLILVRNNIFDNGSDGIYCTGGLYDISSQIKVIRNLIYNPN